MRRAKTDDRGVGAIRIELYHDLNAAVEEQALDFSIDVGGQVYAAEDLCTKVAKHLRLSALSAYLFALFDTEEGEWLSPDREVSSQNARAATKCLRFRMRFIPAVPKIPSLDPNTLRYLYLQCRHDFVHDKITYRKSKNIGREHLLGLGVIDMVRHGKVYGFNMEKLKNMDPIEFIPVSRLTLNYL